jgi:hypothetical protein
MSEQTLERPDLTAAVRRVVRDELRPAPHKIGNIVRYVPGDGWRAW